MKDLRRIPLSIVLAAGAHAAAIALPASGAVSGAEPPTSYVVLLVAGLDGKVVHKPIAQKDQDSFRKSLDEEYLKRKRAWQEERKAFQKEKPGEKFDKPEPPKPKISVAKRDIKSYNEAQKFALTLDKELEAKAKNGKGSKNGKKGNLEKNGKDGQTESGKESKGKDAGKSE